LQMIALSPRSPEVDFTRVASHWCQKYMTSIQDGCCAIKANCSSDLDSKLKLPNTVFNLQINIKNLGNNICKRYLRVEKYLAEGKHPSTNSGHNIIKNLLTILLKTTCSYISVCNRRFPKCTFREKTT